CEGAGVVTKLVPYDAACRALAEAVRVDDVKHILDAAAAMQEYARRAKNRDAEADAVEIRLRATRRLDELRQAQKETVGLAKGGQPYQRRPTGLAANPVATLAMQGIDKNLAHQARVLGAMDEAAFERKVAEARGSAARVFRRAVREVEIAQERAERRAWTDLRQPLPRQAPRRRHLSRAGRCRRVGITGDGHRAGARRDPAAAVRLARRLPRAYFPASRQAARGHG